jgi:hypothetical protein
MLHSLDLVRPLTTLVQTRITSAPNGKSNYDMISPLSTPRVIQVYCFYDSSDLF